MNLEKMPLGKRGYSGLSYNARYKRARTQGRMYKGMVNVLTRTAGQKRPRTQRINKLVISRVNNLYKMIETKEITRKTSVNVALPHNNVYLVLDSGGANLNMFTSGNGPADPMDRNTGERIGDQITVKGVMIKGFFENALARPKVYYRVMVLKGAKGDTFSRATIFKNDSDNKMIDQVNTERFSIVAQKIFTISASNVAASGAEANGAPLIATAGGTGTRTFKMWIPGTKFGRNGDLTYETQSSQCKFYDYRICVLAYDWYGTPQDLNNVGRINEMYTKVYFKDA